MAHFAEIDENNLVLRVLVVSDDMEHRGHEFLSKDLGLSGRWVQTSYNATIRKNYAGIGFTYNESLDAFIPPQCHEEAILNNETARWFCKNGEHNVPVS